MRNKFQQWVAYIILSISLQFLGVDNDNQEAVNAFIWYKGCHYKKE